MKRTTKLAVAVLVVLAAVTGVAVAASSPTVTTGGATKITDTSATLHGTVNPNGSQTGYVFDYGLTNAYGLSTTSHTVSSGTMAVKVSLGISGLTPGTVYHYRIAALNGSGGIVRRRPDVQDHRSPAPDPGHRVGRRGDQVDGDGHRHPGDQRRPDHMGGSVRHHHGLWIADVRPDRARLQHARAGLGAAQRAGAGDPVPLPDRRLPRSEFDDLRC